MKHGILLLFATFALAGCLQTRDEVKEQEEKQVMQSQVKNLQRTSADVNVRFQEIEDEVRKANGRSEVLENRMLQMKTQNERTEATRDQQFKEMNEKLELYKESILKLDAQVVQLNQQVIQLQESGRSAKPAKNAKGEFAEAEELFAKKNWKEAILSYERFRKANPKNKQAATATYKIGVSFQELGMKDEAKAFYEEVVSKHAGSPEANKAQQKLKALKKK